MCALLLCLGGNVDARGLDPTRPLGMGKTNFAESKIEEALLLQSIINTGDKKIAIVNGKILKKGDTYQFYKVVAIYSTSVVFMSAEGKKELFLFSDIKVDSKL